MYTYNSLIIVNKKIYFGSARANISFSQSKEKLSRNLHAF